MASSQRTFRVAAEPHSLVGNLPRPTSTHLDPVRMAGSCGLDSEGEVARRDFGETWHDMGEVRLHHIQPEPWARSGSVLVTYPHSLSMLLSS